MSNDTQVAALTDDECDALVARTMDEVAKAKGLDHAMNLNADITQSHTLRRAIVRAAVETSARQLAEQPGFVMVPVEPTLKQLAAMGPAIRACYELDGIKGDVSGVYRAMLAAARPLTASPTAPSTEASEQVGEREAFEAHWYDFYHAGSIQADADGTYWPKEVQCAWQAWQAARTTSPPAPLSDAEIDALVFDGMSVKQLVRAIEQAIGRASRGAK